MKTKCTAKVLETDAIPSMIHEIKLLLFVELSLSET